jgi:hypothetical protein
MKNVMARMCLVVAGTAAALCAPVSQAQNLVANPGFELAPPNFPFQAWRPIAANNFREQDNATMRTPPGAVFQFPGYFPGTGDPVNNPSGLNTTGWTQVVNISAAAGSPVVASSWVRPAGFDGPNVRAFNLVTFFDGPDGTGNVVGTPLSTPQVDVTNFAPADTYRELSNNSTVPAGALSVRFSVVLEQELAAGPCGANPGPCYNNGNVRFDDASLTINATEVLVNPSFNVFDVNPINNWSPQVGGLNSNANTSFVRTGLRSIRVQGPFFFCGTPGGANQNIPVVEGRKYRFGAWMLPDPTTGSNGNPPNPDNLRTILEIRFKDALGNELRVTGDDTADNYVWTVPGPTPTTFSFNRSDLLTAPVDAVTVDVRTMQFQACFNGEATFWDDVRVQDLTCPGDFTNNGVREPADIFAYLNAYFAGSDLADTNWDGVRAPADIFLFLTQYFAGC